MGTIPLRPQPSLVKSMFEPTDPDSAVKKDRGGVRSLDIEKLVPYKNHPFKLYEGDRKNDMVESIKANGVIIPIIVRKIDDDNYEILSGHNRVECARIAEIDTVPSIIREDLTDEEALLIVTETNLMQRSFADLCHSERAVTLTTHYEAIKQQGKRNDLINELKNLFNPSNSAENPTSRLLGEKLKTEEKIAKEYDLSPRNISRYLRINKLIDCHKNRIDNSEMGLYAGVELSYLKSDEQQIVDDVLISGNYKLDVKKAESLRELSKQKNLTHETVQAVFAGKKKITNRVSPPAIKLKPKIFLEFFKPEQKKEEITNIIIEALRFYEANRLQLEQSKPPDIEEGEDTANADIPNES